MEKSKTYYVAIGAALLAIIGLITPWFRVLVQARNSSIKLSSSGFGLIRSFGSGFGGFLMGIGILVIILTVVVLIAYSIWKIINNNPSGQDALFLLISGGLILFFTVLISGGTTFFTMLLSFLPKLKGEVVLETDLGLTTSSGIGVYLTILAGIAILLAGLYAKGDLKLSGMANMQHRKQSAQPYYPQQSYQQPGQWQAPQQPPQQSYQRPGQWQSPQQGPEEPNQWQAPQN